MATTSHARPASVALLVVLLGGLGLSGCGDETEPTAGDPAASSSTGSSAPSPTDDTGSSAPTSTAPSTPSPPSVPDLPACEQTWGGARLEAPYRGCLEGDQLVEPQVFTCSQGGRLAIYQDSYALVGRVINRADGPLERDPDYRSAIQACTA